MTHQLLPDGFRVLQLSLRAARCRKPSTRHRSLRTSPCLQHVPDYFRVLPTGSDHAQAARGIARRSVCAPAR